MGGIVTVKTSYMSAEASYFTVTLYALRTDKYLKMILCSAEGVKHSAEETAGKKQLKRG